MIFNLPGTLSNFDKYSNKPFPIFEKKNFLNVDLFKKLEENFPDEMYFDKVSDKGNKLSFDNSGKNFFKFLNKSEDWAFFYNEINNKKFINYLFELIKYDLSLIENRKNIKKLNYIKKFSNNFYNRLYRKFLKIKFSNVRIGFQFSKIKKNCFIPPHCDVVNKLLSLMVYFPSNDILDNNSLGTNFYKIKNIRKKNLDIWDSKLMDEENVKEFLENYEIFYKSKFEKNKLVGFIKSNNSWHNVDIIDENIVRNSVNINLYLI